MLNPFFLQGSQGEQGLVQDLINEQLRMYGLDCHYIPRKLMTSRTIMREVTESRFDQAFPLEAYLMNVDGYAGQGDILTKFGVRVTTEATFVISRERFEESVAPFLEQQEDDYDVSNRPREGDLIFFPLGRECLKLSLWNMKDHSTNYKRTMFINYNVNSLNMKMRSLTQMSMQLMRLFKQRVILQG